MANNENKRFVFGLSLLLSGCPGVLVGAASVPGDIAPKGNPDGIVDQQDVNLLLAYLNGESALTDEELRIANLFPPPPDGPDSATNWSDLIHLSKIARGEVPNFDNKPPKPVSRRYTTVDYFASARLAIVQGIAGSAEPAADVLVYAGGGAPSTARANASGGFTVYLFNIEPASQIDVTVRDASGNESVPVSWNALESPGYDGRYNANYLEIQSPTGLADPDPGRPATLAWASIAYPSGTDGSVAFPAGQRMPVAVFIHGVNMTCDEDGAGPSHAKAAPDGCPIERRVPHHRGYRYLMEELASLGIFTISIYNDYGDSDDSGDREPTRTILRYLDLLHDWNQGWDEDDSNLFPIVSGRFVGRLDLQNVALMGHSRGGYRAVDAVGMLRSWPDENTPNPNGYLIRSLVGLAPIDGSSPFTGYTSYENANFPYLLIFGTRDGDVPDMHSMETAHRLGRSVAGSDATFVATAILRGANHKYFNTVWTDTAALGEDNPWAGAGDDGDECFTVVEDPMRAEDQRRVTGTLLKAFLRVQLLNEPHYESVVTGMHRFSSLPNEKLQRILRRGAGRPVSSFDDEGEATPYHVYNALASECTIWEACQGIQSTESRSYARHATDRWLAVSAAPAREVLEDGRRRQETAKVVFNFPVEQDLTGKRLRFRLGKYAYEYPDPTDGPELRVSVNLDDATGQTSTWDLASSDYASVPHPYVRIPAPVFGGGCGWQASNATYLTTVEIPASHLSQGNGELDLTRVTRIVIRSTEAVNFAIDDIEVIQ